MQNGKLISYSELSWPFDLFSDSRGLGFDVLLCFKLCCCCFAAAAAAFIISTPKRQETGAVILGYDIAEFWGGLCRLTNHVAHPCINTMHQSLGFVPFCIFPRTEALFHLALLSPSARMLSTHLYPPAAAQISSGTNMLVLCEKLCTKEPVSSL